MPNLAGLHDIESVKITPPNTWVVDTVALSENPAPKTYPANINVIARLNWGYGSTGTIPILAQYPSFGETVAQYVKGSTGCRRWIIGNEPNLSREWPNGQPIFPWNYAACLHICREEIHALTGHASDEVLLAAPGPWNAELKYEDNPNGDWIKYFTDTIALLNGHLDGFALHAYTHGYDPALVTSTARMDAPFQDRYYEFRTYRDYMHAIPLALENLPVYITEANGGPGWQAVGLMPAMLAEIDKWNHSLVQSIQALVFYRYPHYDDFYIAGRDDVIAEYQAAVRHGYTSPDALKGTEQMSNSNFIPAISNGTQLPALPPRDIDPRLTQRGTAIEEESVEPGQSYWRLVKAQFFDHTQAGGRHHVYVEAVDENGNPVANVPFIYSWPGKSVPIVTNGKTGFDAANQPFSEGRNAFTVQPAQHGDIVRGIGMGEDDPGGWNAGEHTSTLLRYQRQVAPTEEQHPAPSEPAQPDPSPQPTPSGDNWTRSINFVHRWEGGYQNNPNDRGNWTGGAVGVGENKGTKYGISAASYPQLDIPNLTLAEADAIYQRDYWQASNAASLPWPYCLLAFDTAVLHGITASKNWQKEVGNSPLAFAAKRLSVYTHDEEWPYFGAGWVNRVADLLMEASKP